MRQSKNLPEAPIRKFTEFHNPEYKKIYKSTIYIGTILSLPNFVGVQEEKCRGVGRNYPSHGTCLLYTSDAADE